MFKQVIESLKGSFETFLFIAFHITLVQRWVLHIFVVQGEMFKDIFNVVKHRITIGIWTDWKFFHVELDLTGYHRFEMLLGHMNPQKCLCLKIAQDFLIFAYQALIYLCD